MVKQFCFVIIVVLLSCNNNGQTEGGPCTYDTKIYPATVIGIEKKDSLYADIIFRINDDTGNIYRDSVLWSIESNRLIEMILIEKDSIAVGKKYQYRIDNIKTGTCNPNIERLKLEKFE